MHGSKWFFVEWEKMLKKEKVTRSCMNCQEILLLVGRGSGAGVGHKQVDRQTSCFGGNPDGRLKPAPLKIVQWKNPWPLSVFHQVWSNLSWQVPLAWRMKLSTGNARRLSKSRIIADSVPSVQRDGLNHRRLAQIFLQQHVVWQLIHILTRGAGPTIQKVWLQETNKKLGSFEGPNHSETKEVLFSIHPGFISKLWETSEKKRCAWRWYP